MITDRLSGVQEQVVLAPYTTYKIGGPADYFLTVSDKEALAEAVQAAKREGMPYFILGTGANILVSDKGVRGLVIHNQATHTLFEDTHLKAESGVTIASLITETARRGLSGLEHFAGIPSSVGGAIWQNLHFLAPDRERTVFIAEIVEKALILDKEAQVQEVSVDFFEFGYDQSILHRQPELVVLEVEFALTPLDQAEIQHRIQENLAWRGARHPKLSEFPSSGSVFKKIEGVGAGRLIDQAGLKGMQIGGAKVSPQHANFIVNTGGATAQDVLTVIRTVQAKVKEVTGYELEAEIGLVGEW